MKFIRNIFILAAMVFMLSACSLMGGKESIDPPQDVSYEEDLDVTSKEGVETEKAEKVKTELYLIDKDGYVVPQTFELPNKESVAKQALDHLVKDGPITDQLPNDFRAVLPAGTETSVDIKDGVATVDFSNEFTEYAPEDELKILQSVTWTLTQFDSIEKVNLKLNGKQLKEMPVNGTPINGELTRKNGINIETNVADITNTYPVTVYYLAQSNDKSYYVPVTKRVNNKVDDPVMAVVNELIKGPNASSPLYTLFMPDVQLVDGPKLDNGIVKLNFNENIYGSYDQKLVSKQVLEPLVLSLTEQEGVEGVSIQVNGEANVVNQDGQTLSEPVTRPASVNTRSY